MLSALRKIISDWNEKNIPIEKVFLISAIFFGLGYMIINTPNSIYDERAHFVSAYHYSNVLMGKPFSMEDGSFEMRNEDIKSLKYSIFSGFGMFQKIKDEFSFFKTEEGTVVLPYGVAGNFLQFFPQALGITIGRIFNLGNILVYYLGRIMNLAVYIALVYFAIKLIPFGKLIIFMIALMPISMNQAASLSYDVPAMEFSFLYAALIFKVIYEEKRPDRKQFILLSAVIWCLAAQRVGVYIILGGLVFLIPKDNFEKKSQWIKYIAGLCLVFVLSVLVNDITYYFFFPRMGTDTLEGKVIKEFYSLTDLINNPVHFLKMVGATIMEKGNYYIMSSFGGRLGHYDVSIPDTYIWELILIMVVGATLSPKEERTASVSRRNKEEKDSAVGEKVKIRQIKTGHKIWFALLYLIYWPMYWVIFFFSYTPVGETIIYGVQGRYFIPVLYLPFFCLRSTKGRFKKNRDNTLMFLYLILTVLIFSVAVFTVLTEGDAARNMYKE